MRSLNLSFAALFSAFVDNSLDLARLDQNAAAQANCPDLALSNPGANRPRAKPEVACRCLD
jgi:hypothetical protein